MAGKTIAIAGGGIGGMTAALAFAKLGHDVTVYEQAQELGEVGAGIQLSPNAMQVFQSLGLNRHIEALSFEPEFGAMRHYKTGAHYFSPALKAQCRDRYGAPYFHIHRADLHGVLVSAAREAGVTIRLGERVAGYRAEQGGASLLTADGAQGRADLVIGADGLKSRIRDQMLGPDRPRFTGHVAWRGTIPTTRLSPGLVKPGATIWLGPEKHVVTYYVRGGTVVNFAAFEERPGWTNESWTTQGDRAELRRAFGGWHREVSELVDVLEQPFIWALFDRDVLPRWSDGHVTLLGDACHPTLPYMAQGAAMAVEDAFVLANLVSSEAIAPALARYESLRRPRTAMLQNIARQNAKLYHMNGGLSDKLKLLKMRVGRMLPMSMQIKPVDKIYAYNATQI